MFKTIGILAHVDAGKTTFSEQLLFHTHSIKEMGRVDHQTAHLDLHIIEQQRGITVFAEQATFMYEDTLYTIIDTPGHTDFSAEMERSLLALDAAILLIDGASGIQGHTLTIWNLLRQYEIPTFIFVNKMDQIAANEQFILADIHRQLTGNAQSFTVFEDAVERFAALNDETMEAYFSEAFDDQQWYDCMSKSFMASDYFPISFGAALKNEGITEFLQVLSQLLRPVFPQQEQLQAIIYKIRHDEQQQKIAFIKILQGKITVRDKIMVDGELFKVTQLRKYNGRKYLEQQQAFAGETIGVIGLKNSKVGMSIGKSYPYEAQLIPTMRSKIVHAASIHAKEIVAYCRLLEAEDPALEIEWVESLQEIHVKIMGKIQLEVLTQIIDERFGEKIHFEIPTIIYKETIADRVIGYGHFEPLKHYSEVHLCLEAAERGSGIEVVNECHANDMQMGYQSLALQTAAWKTHKSLLTGSALTDVKITLLTGRAHAMHTDGGDFIEATKRAIRQGLEQATIVLLEPFYAFTMSANIEYIGRMMTDIQKLSGVMHAPVTKGEYVEISGRVPVTNFQDYPSEFASYTSGRGSLQVRVDGYDVCHNTAEVVEVLGYKKDADATYTSNSVFLNKGKGYTVAWQDAKATMHCTTEHSL
ncbi:elongation factor G [Kurthia sibirica]|uniref:Elongation factor G n=1 Tax=Kurthia sibirica TaxID=202750 RepID=A0A2U3AIY4_9BACL|nr:TetM/TetW/TetO/TetS family tetracycline resistance ribosomal protection protein [Kurthia sibirica]PWI24509.1 elongation factor G [Kurthia sibirica]GEK33573.1 tetracycline resistance protein [Kurthia sibirica]